MRRLHSVPVEVMSRPYPHVALFTPEEYQTSSAEELRGTLLDAWIDENREAAYALWESRTDGVQYIIYVAEEPDITDEYAITWVKNIHENIVVGMTWSIWSIHTVNMDLRPVSRYDYDADPENT